MKFKLCLKLSLLTLALSTGPIAPMAFSAGLPGDEEEKGLHDGNNRGFESQASAHLNLDNELLELQKLDLDTLGLYGALKAYGKTQRIAAVKAAEEMLGEELTDEVIASIPPELVEEIVVLYHSHRGGKGEVPPQLSE